jgi:calcineurin-like phosphoesterase family protein
MDYVISDLHLGHEKLRALYRNQFSNVEEMHEHIIKMWNDKIKNDDIKIYVLGDIGDKESIEKIFPRLRGTKVLIMGNHDKWNKSFYLKFFSEVYDTPVYWNKRIVMSHHPIPVEPGVINLHGHTHVIDLDSELHFNLCVERTEYKPVRMDKYEKILSKITPPNKRFLEEWYSDIMKPTIERDDIVLDAWGKIDLRATKALKEESRKKKDETE